MRNAGVPGSEDVSSDSLDGRLFPSLPEHNGRDDDVTILLVSLTSHSGWIDRLIVVRYKETERVEGNTLFRTLLFLSVAVSSLPRGKSGSVLARVLGLFPLSLSVLGALFSHLGHLVMMKVLSCLSFGTCVAILCYVMMCYWMDFAFLMVAGKKLYGSDGKGGNR